MTAAVALGHRQPRMGRPRRPLLGGCVAAAAWCYLFGRVHGGERHRRAWLLVLVDHAAGVRGERSSPTSTCWWPAASAAAILAFADAVLLDAAIRGGGAHCWPATCCAALGVLAKGLIGVVLPGLVLVAWLLLRRRPMPIAAAAVVARPARCSCSLTAPWFLAMQRALPGLPATTSSSSSTSAAMPAAASTTSSRSGSTPPSWRCSACPGRPGCRAAARAATRRPRSRRRSAGAAPDVGVAGRSSSASSRCRPPSWSAMCCPPRRRWPT